MSLTKVKLTSSRCGHTSHGLPFAQASGDIVEMPLDEATRYIERGLAVAVNANDQKKG